MRESIQKLEAQFAELHSRSKALVTKLSGELLYAKPDGGDDSGGDQLLRSAAAIEQSFGGLTVNLWDDPFEWTLPETLNTPARVLEYLAEVEQTRCRALASLQSDDELSKEIMTPVGITRIGPFLLDTLRRARHHLQRAEALAESLKNRD